MRRALVLFATLLLLWVIVAQLNHVVSGWRIYFFVGGLFVCYAALTQTLRAGLAASFLGGLICDANTPVAFGTHAVLFAAAHALLFHLRDRLPRDDTASRVVIALLTNLALFLVLSFLHIRHSPAPAVIWPRLLADLFFSQVLLALIAPWFFALQTRALTLTRTERENFT